MGNRSLFDWRHPSLPRLLAIPARSRCADRHLSSARGAPRPDARETGRTEGARHRKELWLAFGEPCSRRHAALMWDARTDTTKAIVWSDGDAISIATLKCDLMASRNRTEQGPLLPPIRGRRVASRSAQVYGPPLSAAGTARFGTGSAASAPMDRGYSST